LKSLSYQENKKKKPKAKKPNNLDVEIGKGFLDAEMENTYTRKK